LAVIAEDGEPAPLARADEQVIAAIALEVGPTDPRAERAELAGQQRLPGEIVERLIEMEVV